jgi:hypothetical protein
MSGVSVDHVVSLIILLAAICLFIGLFDQTLSVALDYQRNTTTAKECDDLLDEILLTPSTPLSGTPTLFGMQDSTLTTYNLDPFSLMRLDSSAGTPITYQKTGETYSSVTTTPNNYLLYPYSDMINYSTASALLGLQRTYGFQLSFSPTVNVTITQISTNPLTLSLTARGTGFPLANATVNYLLLPISLSTNYPEFETVANQMGETQTNQLGTTSVTFSNFYPSPNLSYAFVACAYLDGISGIGYYVNSPVGKEGIVPFLDPLSTLDVTLANSNDVPATSTNVDSLSYNSTFIFESENYAFEQTSIGSSNSFGSVKSGSGNSPVSITMSSYTPGILVVAYKNSGNSGVVMVPWGFSSLGFSLTFGGTPINQAWIATDLRQVEINGVSYQATLSLWSMQGYGGIG